MTGNMTAAVNKKCSMSEYFFPRLNLTILEPDTAKLQET